MCLRPAKGKAPNCSFIFSALCFAAILPSFSPVRGCTSPKAWISLVLFGRIGAFQWVTANPNKKIYPPFPGMCKVSQDLLLCAAPAQGAQVGAGEQKHLA